MTRCTLAVVATAVAVWAICTQAHAINQTEVTGTPTVAGAAAQINNATPTQTTTSEETTP